MTSTKRKPWPAIAALIALVAFWECAAAALGNPRLVPGLRYVATESFPSFAVFGESEESNLVEATKILAWHAGETARRALLGTAVGGCVGILAGLVIYGLGARRWAHGRCSGRLRACRCSASFPFSPTGFPGAR